MLRDITKADIRLIIKNLADILEMDVRDFAPRILQDGVGNELIFNIRESLNVTLHVDATALPKMVYSVGYTPADGSTEGNYDLHHTYTTTRNTVHAWYQQSMMLIDLRRIVNDCI